MVVVQGTYNYTFFKKESSISLTTTTKSSVEGMLSDALSSLRRLAQATNSFVAVSLFVKFYCLFVHRVYIVFYIDDMANTRRPFSLASI